jgi:hypothetical protein
MAAQETRQHVLKHVLSFIIYYTYFLLVAILHCCGDIMASHTTNTIASLDHQQGFPLKALPIELRLKIYPSQLRLQYEKQAPALLLALAADKDLYQEVKEVFRKLNICFTGLNSQALKEMSLSKIFQFRHLNFQWVYVTDYALQYVPISSCLL